MCGQTGLGQTGLGRDVISDQLEDEEDEEDEDGPSLLTWQLSLFMSLLETTKE